jgi:aspartyl-tRNA(Asn)/glutamyl-tRNA(Gln) amidotransferase subunit A
MSFPLTIVEAAAALRDGSMISVELVQKVLSHADALDDQLGVYITRFDEQALRVAAQADADLAAGIDHGSLHGIPLAIKDILAASEGSTTAQSLVLDRSLIDGRRLGLPIGQV